MQRAVLHHCKDSAVHQATQALCGARGGAMTWHAYASNNAHVGSTRMEQGSIGTSHTMAPFRSVSGRCCSTLSTHGWVAAVFERVLLSITGDRNPGLILEKQQP